MSKPVTSGLAMGIYDSPQTQAQPILYLDHIRSNIAVFGGPMSGKTTFVRTMLVRMHELPYEGPGEDVYIIDFGGNLGEYAGLPRVCACFDDTNEENIKRVFKTIEKRMSENAAALGSSSYVNMARRAPEKCPEHITLIIENVNAFLTDERYASYQDRLMDLCRDGLSKGISVVVTANDTAGTGRLMTYFAQKIAYEMPADNYMEIFNTKVTKPMKLPGRGLVSIESSVYEFQTFLPFADEESDELTELIRLNAGHANPHILSGFSGDLTMQTLAGCCDGPLPVDMGDEIMVGLDYDEHRPVTVDIRRDRSIAIYGRRQFGKTNLLQLLHSGIRERSSGCRFVYLDDGREQLKAFYDADKTAGEDAVYLTSVSSLCTWLLEQGYIDSRTYGAGAGRPAGVTGAAGQVRPGAGEGPAVPSVPTPAMQAGPAASAEKKLTVFVLQSKSLYQVAADNSDASRLMRRILPEMVGEADTGNYLFIFSEVRRISAADVQPFFNNNISTAFLLDDIGEFVSDKGSRSVFGEMDPKELKAEYARCVRGDGYYYDVEGDRLKKLRFIKTEM